MAARPVPAVVRPDARDGTGLDPGLDGRTAAERLHTHLAENDHDMAYSREKFNCTPAQYAQDLGPSEMGAREALALATRRGAQVLGRSDIGHLAVGMCADLALFDLRSIGFAGGAVHDPIGALIFCANPQAAHVVVNGRLVVREG